MANHSVGDSPRGPLKQLGNPHLKPATSQSQTHLTKPCRTRPMSRRPQRPTKAAHSEIPSSRLRLARGCAPPSGGLRPVRGGALTSSGLRLARGSALPSNVVRLARGRSARAPASVRGHLMPRQRRGGAIMRLGLTPRYHRTNSPGGSPSPPLWGTVWRGWCQSRDASPPTPVRLTRRALEGGPAAPSTSFLVTLQS
jgi:hypothetical protein